MTGALPARSRGRYEARMRLRHLPFVVLAFTACNSSAPPKTLTPELQATGVANLAMPQPGVLTAGQPTEEQLAQLAALGVKKVVCLRAPTEKGTGWEEAKAAALGVQFVRLPITGEDGLTQSAAERLAAELGSADGTAMVCCGSSNRVGALLALKAFWVDKKPAAEALELGKQAGLKAMLPAVEAKLK